MILKEYLAYVNQLVFYSRGKPAGSAAGEYTIAKKGFGLEFNQIRDYASGDDIRHIDWNSSSRLNKLLVKEYFDDKNRTVQILLDVSPTTFFGSDQLLKIETMVDIASVLAIAADRQRDKIGLVIFSDTVHTVLPPTRGSQHLHQILKAVWYYRYHCLELLSRFQASGMDPQNLVNSNRMLAKQLVGAIKKEAMVFVVSDFINTNYLKTLSSVKTVSDLVGIRCLDRFERNFEYDGLLQCTDIVAGRGGYGIRSFLSGRSRAGRNGVRDLLQDRIEKQRSVFVRHRIDHCDITTGDPSIKNLLRFFKSRMAYRR